MLLPLQIVSKLWKKPHLFFVNGPEKTTVFFVFFFFFFFEIMQIYLLWNFKILAFPVCICLISLHRAVLDHMLLLNTNRTSYMGSPTEPLGLTLSDLVRSKVKVA